MTRNALISKLIILMIVLGCFWGGQLSESESSVKSEPEKDQAAVQKDQSNEISRGQVAVTFSRDEIDSIATALPDGEARQIFKEKVTEGEKKDDASFNESLRSGEEISLFFFNGEKAFSRAQERLVSFFSKPTSPIDKHKWAVALDNLNLGKGFGHLVLTLFVAALLVFTIPFGDMGAVQNFSRDYIITKLDIRVRYDADIEKIRKIIKKINKELQKNEEIGPVLLSKIKSQGVREMDDSAMILRVKFKTIPGEQFGVRREVYRLIQERFRENSIEFAYRNVTVYLPTEASNKTSDEEQEEGAKRSGVPDKKILEAGAAAALAAVQVNGEVKKTKE